METNGRAAIDFLSRSIQNAGYNINRGSRFLAASDYYISTVFDENDNGVIQNDEIITLSVNPSDSIAPGLYTFALSITEKASGQKGVSTNSGVLSLIFITIGSPDAKAELLDFSVDEERFDQLPVNFAITVRNAGERIVQPTGSIQIYNVFGTIVRQLPVNVDGKRILAGDDRTLMVQWGSGEGPQSYVQKLYVQVSQFAFGPFSAELTITPWEGADPLTQQISLFAFPWQLFLVLCLVITAIVVLARLRTHS